MKTRILQGTQSGNPFTYPDTIYVIDDYVIINPDNALPILIASNCILRFTGAGDPDVNNNNGRGLLRGATPFKLVGNNTRIEAGDYHILDDSIELDGSFSNAEWPAEWWGAKSDGTDAAPAINRALEQIGNTDKQGTLLLADRYEVHDTIYMRPGVAISGVSSAFSQKFYDTQRDMRGTLVVDMVDSVIDNTIIHSYEKWVIDTPYTNGNKIPRDRLYIEQYNLLGSKYTGCNITNLHIVNKPHVGQGEPKCYFGGIRIHSMQAATIRNVDIEPRVFIGLALVGKVWLASIDNVYVKAYGCGLYAGRSCTNLTSHNLGMYCWNDTNGDAHFRLALPENYSGSLVAPVLQPNTLPPYWDKERMRSCGIIMDQKSHCLFSRAAVERFDAVICGVDYNAKFISPYIENIHYTFGWLYATTDYSIPSHRYELTVEDMVSGFETFPAMDMENGEYKYLKKVNYYDLIPPPVVDPQPEGNRYSTPVARDGNLAVVSEKWIYLFLPTFGTVRGVVRAFNVGRATCWEDNAANAETWNYPSYFIHVSPGLQQRNLYYDHYLFVQEKETDGDGAVVNESTWLEDVRYCKYKRIILEQNGGPVRYFYHHVHDMGGTEANDDKVIGDIYKRQLQLGVSPAIPTLSGEMFTRKLDHFIMTPLRASTKIDYDDIVERKEFTIEIIDGAKYFNFKRPLRLRDCTITFKNSYHDTANIENNSSIDSLLEISGNCTINFVGDISFIHGSASRFIKLCGDRHVNLTIRLINTFPIFNENFTYNQVDNRYDFIVNSGVDYSGSEPVLEFLPGCDVEVETLTDYQQLNNLLWKQNILFE